MRTAMVRDRIELTPETNDEVEILETFFNFKPGEYGSVLPLTGMITPIAQGPGFKLVLEKVAAKEADG